MNSLRCATLPIIHPLYALRTARNAHHHHMKHPFLLCLCLVLCQTSSTLADNTAPGSAPETAKPTTEEASSDALPLPEDLLTGDEKTAGKAGDATQAPSVPQDLVDDEHLREELAINEFTAPSIAKVFESLQSLSPLPYAEAQRTSPDRMPLDRADLAMEIGFLIADGFLVVQSDNLTGVEPIAKQLSRYGKALGAGDRVSRHVASLLENARENRVDALKKELTATQKDVEQELVALRDTDLAHLISLGGWLRALNIASLAVTRHFTPDRAREIFREDIADYYTESLGTLHPRISERANYMKMREILSDLRNVMVLEEQQQPTPDKVADILKSSQLLLELAAKRAGQ